VSAFKHLWRESWGPRLEYILYASFAALLECDNTSLLGVPRMLSDERYRNWVVKQVRDPVVRSFWENEFARYDKKFRAEAIAPIQNKVGQLLMAEPLRNIFGQVRSKFDARFMMDKPLWARPQERWFVEERVSGLRPEPRERKPSDVRGVKEHHRSPRTHCKHCAIFIRWGSPPWGRVWGYPSASKTC
jgi:hypothetical protein